jgi:NAD(P)-dependent dehydrogenase (short-subunit alcohol dehydrogenase family)
MKKRNWFITGISSGLGKALAEAVIAEGDFVIGTFRREADAKHFNTQNEGRAYALVMDVTDETAVQSAFQYVSTKWGIVDVLVNNAGYGMAGAIEETSEQEARDLFEANFFGALRVTRTFLPLFRQQRHGHIIQVSSHGGFRGFAGFGIYNASKFALEGFSEALALELGPLNVKLTIIEPGPFRTGFAGDSFRQARMTIDDYSETAGQFRQRIKMVDGKQEGDPKKAAKAIINITHQENPPLRLPLGRIAVATILSKLESVQLDLQNGRRIAEDSVFDS